MPKCDFCDKPIAPGTTSCPYCRAPITSKQSAATEDLEQRVRSLWDQGDKIAAIKVYREETGAGLADAKEAVESLQAGSGLPVHQREIPEGFEGDVLRLLGAGKKIQAIKLYREQVDCGLKEAKEAVEALGEKNGIVVRGSGCLGVVLVFAVGIVLTWLMI